MNVNASSYHFAIFNPFPHVQISRASRQRFMFYNNSKSRLCKRFEHPSKIITAFAVLGLYRFLPLLSCFFANISSRESSFLLFRLSLCEDTFGRDQSCCLHLLQSLLREEPFGRNTHSCILQAISSPGFLRESPAIQALIVRTFPRKILRKNYFFLMLPFGYNSPRRLLWQRQLSYHHPNFSTHNLYRKNAFLPVLFRSQLIRTEKSIYIV